MPSLGELLRQRKRLVGCFQRIPTPESTEAAAFAGLDFVVVDTEHGLIGDEGIGALVHAAEAAGITPLVRLARADAPRIGRLLDAGVAGIVLAHVRSAADAEELVAAMRYPPEGHRSAAGSRVTGYGRSASLAEHLASDAASPTVIAMVEDRGGVERAGEIAGVAGVDALLVGTSDLSTDLGFPGRTEAPEVVRAVEAVCDAAARHGISAGLPLAADADVGAALSYGATFVATSDIYALITGLERFRTSATAET